MNTKTSLLAAILVLATTFSYGQATTAVKKTTSRGNSQANASLFNGAWVSTGNNNMKGYSVMNNGHFNSVFQDSTGKWSSVHAGTYTINDDNTITFKVQYSSYPDHVGAANTAEYTISGDTVKLRHFKKLIDKDGNDITANMPKDEWETMIRER